MDANDQSMLFFSSRTHAEWCNILHIYALLCFALFPLFFPRCDVELLVGQIWIA
jgi:hypothetical protein